jgi:hypothetical protein
VHAFCYAIVALATLPIAVVIYTSFLQTNGPVFSGGFGLNSYARVIQEVPDVIANTFKLLADRHRADHAGRRAHLLHHRAPRNRAVGLARLGADGALRGARRGDGDRLPAHLQQRRVRPGGHGSASSC